MAREKMSPGLKILWVWTIGTAAVLVTNVMRTRLGDMEKAMNAQQQPQQGLTSDSLIVDTSPDSDDGIVGEVK